MESVFKNKTVGIWGFGKTGQSVLKFIESKAKRIFILEDNILSKEQQKIAQQAHATFVEPSLLNQFLEICDIIIPSPGIDLRPYTLCEEKFLSELDIFAQHITTKTIAITGSVGKTTIVTLLTDLLNRLNIKSCAAGNIGTPMLDILSIQNNYEWIVLELSSFQLEQIKLFAPTIAVITNLFENHLDRHGDMISYAQAKSHIFKYQNNDQQLIISQDFFEYFIDYTKNQKVLWLSKDTYENEITHELSDVTFPSNWNIIFAIFEFLNIEPKKIISVCADLKKPEHRLELVETLHNISFYNDSKATIPAATLASLENFKDKSVILFLGGVSKGVNRSEMIKKLPKTLKHILCFGKESEELFTFCKKEKFTVTSHKTFEDSWKHCLQIMKPKDIILFSPSGASFDLFKNYEERGNLFKKNVYILKESIYENFIIDNVNF